MRPTTAFTALLSAVALTALTATPPAAAQSLPRVDVTTARAVCLNLQAQLDERLQHAWQQQTTNDDIQLRFRPQADGVPEVQILSGSRRYASAARRAVVQASCEGDGQTWYRLNVSVVDGEAGRATTVAESR